MTNWKEYKSEIEIIRDELVQHNNTVYEIATIRAICKVYARVNGIDYEKEVIYIPDAIDWLTQEAESEEKIGSERLFENRCKNIIEQEAYSKGHIDGYNECLLIHKKEPQQSKARFIKTNDNRLINVNHIATIKQRPRDVEMMLNNALGSWAYIDGASIQEVIQQLGIEVV